MDIHFFIEQMKLNLNAILKHYEALDDDFLHWKQFENKWSLLEILNHLCDEERADFRLRLDYTLNRPGETWPIWQPLKLVEERNYNQLAFDTSLTDFTDERKKSIQWLQELGEINWEADYIHPEIGRMTAGDLMAAWLAHDYLHLRQIANTKLEYLRQLAQPYSLRYAG